jgi:MULE transposase domain
LFWTTMTSPAAAVHIAHASETSSESRGSAGTAAGVRISSTPKRRQWSTVVVAVPATLEEELGRYGPLCKSDTKAGKTYYKCKLHSRFSCGMMVRTVPEIETGSTCIQLCGLEHCHVSENEHFIRGLSAQVKKSIDEITKFNLKIRPATLHRMLLVEPYSFEPGMVRLDKIRGYLRRIRNCASETYMEYTIAGLWNAVNSNQPDAETPLDENKYYFLLPARETLINIDSDADARVQVVGSTDGLLRNFVDLQQTQCAMQLVVDSKHRVLLNNYPITVVGILDAAQQFHLLALAVSNKENEEFFYDLLQAVKTSLIRLGARPDIGCTMSDNSNAIQNALRRSFPDATIGNCIFHLQQNIKKKRGLWNVVVPDDVSANKRSQWAVRRRDINESFARHCVQWIASLHHLHEFVLCSELFLSYLESQGDFHFAGILRRDYFSKGKTGWARHIMPKSCAATNNSLEAFNGNVLAKDIVAGSRTTMAQFFTSLEGLFRSQSSLIRQSVAPLTAVDARPSVRTSSRKDTRIKEWYSKAIEFLAVYEDGPVACYESDGNGGFYVVSSASRLKGISIRTLLERSESSFSKVLSASSDSTFAVDGWQSVKTAHGDDSGGFTLIPPSVANGASLQLRAALDKLRDAILERDTSFYWVRATEANSNLALLRAKEHSLAILDDPAAASYEKQQARKSLDADHFMWMGVMSHDCSCPEYWLYGGCKHALWATMLSTGQSPPPNVDPRPLAGRRRAGRPRRVTTALQPMSNEQDPAI